MPQVLLRPATPDDAQRLFEWRNDPVTRANSHNTAPILYVDHLRWLDWNLKDPFVRIFIGMVNGIEIGTVRVEEENTGKLLSWTVAPDHRGNGYGLSLVKAVVAITQGKLKAEIRTDNAPSRHIAVDAGMTLDHETAGICYYTFVSPDFIHDHLAVLRHL